VSIPKTKKHLKFVFALATWLHNKLSGVNLRPLKFIFSMFHQGLLFGLTCNFTAGCSWIATNNQVQFFQ